MEMDMFIMVTKMEGMVKELRDNEKKYIEERDQIEARLKELNQLIAPIKTDIEGLELAIEGIKSTSFGSDDNKPLQAVDVVTPEMENSLDSIPAKPMRKGSHHPRKALRVYQFDQYNNLVKTYDSIEKAYHDLKWTKYKTVKTAALSKEVQIKKNGFYVSIARAL